MKKRSLKAVFAPIICVLTVGMACMVATNGHGYSTTRNHKNEKVLEEDLNSSLLTTQAPKEKEVTKTTTNALACENVAVTTQVPKEEVTKTTTKASTCEDVAITSQTQTRKSQGEKVFPRVENTTTVQTTREKESNTNVTSTVILITEMQSQNTTIKDEPIEISQKTKIESTATTEIKAVERVTTQLKATTVTTEIKKINTTTTELETTTTTTTEPKTVTTVITEPETTTTTATIQFVEENNIQENDDIQEENDIQEETTIPRPNDCLIIGDRIIEIVYGPATQEMVDNNDVVQDTELWSDKRNKYFFGHNMYSFSCLFGVELRDIITLVNDGVETKYQVFRCETGKLTEDRRNIESSVDGTYLIDTDFGCETIRMITCESVFYPPSYRWVVIGEKIE